jgi:very-long-chain enoyl-CoA reductase
MPISNLFRNSLYYYVFAFFANYYLTHPQYTAPSMKVQRVGLGLFAISEILNGYCHWKLSSLRPSGTKVRQVPRGLFFDSIVAPNYTFEILSWLGFTLASGLYVVGGLFTLASAGILAGWAAAKKRRYMKEFDGVEGRDLFPHHRANLFPGIF